MPATIEQTWVLATREMRLLARSRGRLLCALTIPLTGGLICGWMTRTTSLPPIYCLFLFVALGGIILAIDPNPRVSMALSAVAKPGIVTAGWMLGTAAIIIAQAALLTVCAALIGRFQVSTGVLAGAIGVSLALSILAHR